MGLHASPLTGARMGSVTYRVLCLAHTLVLALPPAPAEARPSLIRRVEPSPCPNVSASVTAYYLFEVSETIRLGALQRALGPAASLATLYDKAPGAPRFRYIQPPVIVDGEALGEPADRRLSGSRQVLRLRRDLAGARPRRCPGPGRDLVLRPRTSSRTRHWRRKRKRRFQRILASHRALPRGCASGRARRRIPRRRRRFAFDPPLSGAAMLERYGADIAQILRGERQPLSAPGARRGVAPPALVSRG